MDYKEFISKRITEFRLKKDISSRAMSLELGLSNSYITQIENKDKMPSMENLVKICDYFGISLKEFFNDGAAEIPEITKLNDSQLQKLNEFIQSL